MKNLLLKRHDTSVMKSFDIRIGKQFYSTLKKSAKVRKISKEISSQLGENKAKPKQSTQRSGSRGNQPFQKGPPSANRGGDKKVSFKRGTFGSNRGKFLFNVSSAQKQIKVF